MVGAATQHSIKLWVQTTGPAAVQFAYFPVNQPSEKTETAEIATSADNAFVAQIELQNLRPGRKYTYQLLLNNELVPRAYPLEFSTAPATDSLPDFTFAAGSCAYLPENPADPRLQIYPAIEQQKPDFMLWLGDNVYMGQADWNSLPGYFRQYTANRSTPKLQPLLASVAHYAIWDDHDFGNNNANRNWPHKDKSLQAFRTFWPNPAYPEKGTYSSFRYADAEFFLLDARYFRSSSRARMPNRELLGQVQLGWLLNGLKNSTATFKFICIGSQVLSTAKSSENYSQYGRELQILLTAISQADSKGIVFLDGDRHISELSRYLREGQYPLLGLTVSPLTSSPGSGGRNFNRVPGTLVTQENFATLSITGSKGNRHLTMRIHDAGGRLIWTRTMAEHELR